VNHNPENPHPGACIAIAQVIPGIMPDIPVVLIKIYKKRVVHHMKVSSIFRQTKMG
jgi:hypothetical protein